MPSASPNGQSTKAFCALTILILLLVGVVGSAYAEFFGRVVGVIDGDSIRVMYNGKPQQIRLIGIDCPEKRQPYGKHAKAYTAMLAFGQNVTAIGDRRDRYGGRLAEVLLPNGRSLNQELIKSGLAWWFRKYSKDLRLGNWNVKRRSRS